MSDEPERTSETAGSTGTVKPAEGTKPAKPTRRIDARSLRGLAHPMRMSILELLSLDGPATSTGLAERLGESTGTISWHLRHLAEHGFIEEEVGRGTKRERWWRRVRVATTLSINDFQDDPDTRGALSVYLHESVQRYFSRVVDYVSENWDVHWRAAGTLSDSSDLYMTPSQLASLNAELLAVIARHAPDPDAEPAPDALPVVVQLQSFPRRKRGTA